MVACNHILCYNTCRKAVKKEKIQMGFVKKLTNSILRATVTKIGFSTGSTFANGELGTGQKNGVNAIVIMGSAYKEDYAITKDDIAECKTLEVGSLYNFHGQPYLVNRYHITFKDGNSAVIGILPDYISTFETMIY